MDSEKSTRQNKISNQVLKLTAPFITKSHTYIFNLCIEKNVFPSQFQKAKVIPLSKTRYHKNLNDYRSISLLSVLSKLLERHVHKNLVTYLETRDLFHPLQSGFCRKHSCNTALSRLTDSWLSAINRSDLSGDVFLDLQKAFDLVDHRILLPKVSVYLNSSNSLRFISSYLKNRVQRVFIRGSYSSEGTVKYGVPEGSVLGPVLFCIYINDLPLQIPSNSAEWHMLADDTTLHTTGKNVVQIRISVWCNINHIFINPVKTKSMIITTRQKHQLSDLSLRLSLDGQNIENVTEHRLLSLIVDNKFRWQAQIKHICKSM